MHKQATGREVWGHVGKFLEFRSFEIASETIFWANMMLLRGPDDRVSHV